LAIDTAALLLQGSPVALLELQLLSSAFFQYSVPTGVPALLRAIQSLSSQTGALGLAPIQAGISLARSLQHPNP
jgi:hypothetical protein